MRKMNGDDYAMLRDAFLDAFDKGGLEALVMVTFGGSLDAYALGDDLEIIVLRLIEKARANNGLMKLLDAAVARTGNPKLEEAVKKLKPVRDLEETDHYNICFLSDSRVLVNRKDLRSTLKQLDVSAPRGFRVLVIDGPPVSGKTYSTELIAYLYETRGRFEPVWINLKDYVKTGVRPIDIAEEISLKMDIDISSLPPSGQEQDARWTRNFRNMLVGKLRKSTVNWWIIIDGFNELSLPPAVNDMIQSLARISRMDLQGLRLVLLSYKDELPDMAGHILQETIKPINQDDLSDFFIQLYEENNKPYTPRDVAQRVAEILRAVDPRDPRRVEKLGVEAAKVAKAIIG